MTFQEVLEEIEETTKPKPRLKKAPSIAISEAAVIEAYCMMAKERYDLITERNQLRINNIKRGYMEDGNDAELNNNADGKQDEEKKEDDSKDKKKSKSSGGGDGWFSRAFNKIKDLIRALINALKGLFSKIFGVFKKKKPVIEKAVENRVGEVESALEKVNNINELNDKDVNKRYPIIINETSDLNFFGYTSLGFSNKINNEVRNTKTKTMDGYAKLFNIIIKSVGDVSVKPTQVNSDLKSSSDIEQIKKQFGLNIKMMSAGELAAAAYDNKDIISAIQKGLVNYGNLVEMLSNKYKIYISMLSVIEKNIQYIKPSKKMSEIEFRGELSKLSSIFTGFNAVVTYASAFYYKMNAKFLTLLDESKKIIIMGGKTNGEQQPKQQ